MSEMSPFSGFNDPFENWSKLPHQFVELLLIIKSLAELKVVLYILRHTWGYGEQDGEFKRISLDEFEHGRKRKDGTRMDNGVGMNREAVVEGLRRAQNHGFIVCEVDDRDRGRVKKSYALRMYGEPLVGFSDSVHRKKLSERKLKKDHSAKISHYAVGSASLIEKGEEEGLSEQKGSNTSQPQSETQASTSNGEADSSADWDVTQLESLILAKVAVRWLFSVTDARTKLARLYQ